MSKLVHNNQIFLERRRELRKNQTEAEKKLWRCLRGNFLGVKFKRQHGIGGYILDFYCADKKLIVELDGEVHNTKDAREYDEIRDKYFADLGYKTIRFFNSQIESNIEEVIDTIRLQIHHRQ